MDQGDLGDLEDQEAPVDLQQLNPPNLPLHLHLRQRPQGHQEGLEAQEVPGGQEDQLALVAQEVPVAREVLGDQEDQGAQVDLQQQLHLQRRLQGRQEDPVAQEAPEDQEDQEALVVLQQPLNQQQSLQGRQEVPVGQEDPGDQVVQVVPQHQNQVCQHRSRQLANQGVRVAREVQEAPVGTTAQVDQVRLLVLFVLA